MQDIRLCVVGNPPMGEAKHHLTDNSAVKQMIGNISCFKDQEVVSEQGRNINQMTPWQDHIYSTFKLSDNLLDCMPCLHAQCHLVDIHMQPSLLVPAEQSVVVIHLHITCRPTQPKVLCKMGQKVEPNRPYQTRSQLAVVWGGQKGQLVKCF